MRPLWWTDVAGILTLNEPGHGGYQPAAPFGLHSDGVPPHEILRLLLGSVNVTESSTGALTQFEFSR